MCDQNSGHFPFEMQVVEEKEIEQAIDILQWPKVDFVRVGPKGYLFPRIFEKYAADYYNMPIRQSDIFVSSYQRSGTTWTQELVWLVANDLDYVTAKSTPLTQRCPFLEYLVLVYLRTAAQRLQNTCDGDKPRETMEVLTESATKILAGTPGRRFIKSHLPLSFLPPTVLDTAKIVYVARDPRDVAVSCYYHTKLYLNQGCTGDFKQFWNVFMNNLYTIMPSFEHVKEAWAQRHHPNMLFLFYEELAKDLPSAIRRVADFLGKKLTTEQIAGLCDHLHIDNFKNNESVNYAELRKLGILAPEGKFIRKGKAGGWREYFDPDMTQQAERWIADNLRDTDLRFPSMENELLL